MRKFSRKTTIIASTMALVVVTSVVAYAFWTNTGAGSGEASTGTNTVTVEQTSTVDGLVPGGPAGDLSGTITNPNPTSVVVNQLIASLSVSPGGDTSKPPCTAADFLLTGSPLWISQTIPPTSSIPWSGMSLQLKETGLNQDNCKSATVTINYSTN